MQEQLSEKDIRLQQQREAVASGKKLLHYGSRVIL